MTTEAELDALDAADAARLRASLHAAALWYAEQGLAVFPLQPGAKIPLISRKKGGKGCHDATTDTSRITVWWTVHPDANIGLATGHLVDVVDIDGAIGQKSRATHWCAEGPHCDALTARPGEHPAELSDQGQVATCGHGPGMFTALDVLGTVLTPRPGGMHLYVPASGKGNKAGLLPGVDYRGAGGYVVAPPSRTDVGSYRWLVPLAVTA